MMAKFSSFSFCLLSSLCIGGLSGSALAQTPAPNLMPDGSHDLYIGLGAESHPAYQGARDTQVKALPVVQMQWSNGAFIAGASAGMHLSDQAQQEYGPLLMIEGRRSLSGTSTTAGSINNSLGANPTPANNKLTGMEDIKPRVLLGGFYHFNMTDALRLTNSALYGAGNKYNGLRWNSDLRYQIAAFAPHHSLSVSTGVTIVNQAYNQAYFGVTAAEAARNQHNMYTPSAGVKDVHADLHWNWALSSSWLLTSALNVTRLQGSAADSPLVERRSNVTVSSALAYRF